MYLLFNTFLFLLFLFPLVIIHEFGHAFVAKVFGFRIFSVTVGYGKHLFEIKPYGISVRFNLYPLSGFTMAIPQNDKGFRLKYWLYVFGGPATHLAFILILGPIFISKASVPNFLTRPLLLEPFLLTNLFLLVVNLIPNQAKGVGPNAYTDGHHLLHVPFFNSSDFARIIGLGRQLEALELMRAGNYAEATVIFEELIAERPADAVVKHDFAIVKLGGGDYQSALDTFEELWDAGGLATENLDLILKNNIALLTAIVRKSEKYIEAENYSREALAHSPLFPPFLATRGLVMLRTDRIVEGLDHLKKAYNRHSRPAERASDACFIAIGEAQRNDLKRSAKWLETAKRECPGYSLIALAESEIQEIKNGEGGPAPHEDPKPRVPLFPQE
jgi:hypothetical protein